MNNMLLGVIALFIILTVAIVFMPKYSGLLLMFSLILFGSLSILWKDGQLKLLCLVALVILSLVNIGANGIKFGIDFVGGTRIPVLLEHPVNEQTMEQLVSIIKTRASVLGLTEAKVRAIGDSEVQVEVPKADESQIAFIESVLSHQGVYLGVVDGKIALKGEDIYPYSIYTLTAQELGNRDWGVSFTITQNAAENFATIVKGKAGYPVYMFLDREEDAVVFLTKEELIKNAPDGMEYNEVYDAVKEGIKLEGSSLSIYIIGEEGGTTIPKPMSNKTKVIISKEASSELKANLTNMGYVIREKDIDEISPKLRKIENEKIILSEWKAIGLLDSPTLSADITKGAIFKDYSIGGSIPYKTGAEKQKEIDENTKRIESILKGGSLPVGISIGSVIQIPPSLGSEFLRLSVIGVGAALVAVAVFIGIRYRHLRIIGAILAISISELIILSAILGSFTIDLAGMAGIIAAIAVGIDAQIVITDELLKKGIALYERLNYAFDIIKMSMVVAIVAMIPLLFSHLVEVIGFAIANILGSLLGVMLSRPAYGVLAEKILEHNKE